jgi:hypothetical protein
MRYASLESQLALPDNSFIEQENYFSVVTSFKENKSRLCFRGGKSFRAVPRIQNGSGLRYLAMSLIVCKAGLFGP